MKIIVRAVFAALLSLVLALPAFGQGKPGLHTMGPTTSDQLRSVITNETGTGSLVFGTSPTLVTPNLGTPSALDLTNATGLPPGGLTGLGTGVATLLATPSSANLRTALTDETGTGVAVFATSPTLTTPVLGVATGTSLGLGGATIGANALAVTGTAVFNNDSNFAADVLLTGTLSRFVRNSSSVHAVNIVNTHASGFSSIRFDKSDLTDQVDIGFGNASASSPFTGVGFLRYVPDFKFVTSSTVRGTMFSTGGFSWGDTTDPGANNFRAAGAVQIGGTTTFTTGAIQRSQASQHVLTIANLSASGYSSLRFDDSSSVEKFNFGYGNASTGSPYTSSGFLRYVPDFKFVSTTTHRGTMWASGGFSWGAGTTDPGANNVMFNGTIYTPKSGISGFFSYPARSAGGSASEFIYSTDTASVGAFGVRATNTAGFPALVYRGADDYEHSAIGVSNPDTAQWSEEKATFTGVISGTTLTASGSSGNIRPGQMVKGVGVTAATYIDADTGGGGGDGTYTVTKSQTVSSVAMSTRVGLAYWEASVYPAWSTAKPFAVKFVQTGYDDILAGSAQYTWLYRSDDFITSLYGRNSVLSLRIESDGKVRVATALTSGPINYAADAEASDTYVVALSPAPASYTTGMEVTFRANTANTGAATINVNGLGAKTIVKAVSTTLANNDILANMFCKLVYDGTNFVLMNPRAL